MKKFTNVMLTAALLAGLAVACTDRYGADEDVATTDTEYGTEYGATDVGPLDEGVAGPYAGEGTMMASADVEQRLAELETRIEGLEEFAEEAGREDEVARLAEQQDELEDELNGLGEGQMADTTADVSIATMQRLDDLEMQVASLEAELGVAPATENTGG